jgi:hypothetical protein
MNILVTSASLAAAHQLKTELNADNVILGDYMDLPGFMLQSGKLISLPNPASMAYAHEMLTLCLDKDIHKIYTFSDNEAKLLLESEQLFKEYDIDVIFCDQSNQA